MSKIKLLTTKQQMAIIQSIQDAEKRTSGEIRLHIENHCKIPVLNRAKEVFHILQMHLTENRNGVLIYLAVQDRQMAIIGDEGIHTYAPENFWNQELKNLIESFKVGDYQKGIIETVGSIGEKLEQFFPVSENDINELPNEISYYEN